MESLCSYPKMPENLPKTYADNSNVSEDPPITFGTRSQDIICQAQPLLFSKSEEIGEFSMEELIALITNYTFTYNLFSRCLSDMAAKIHTFQLGVRNWSLGVLEREIKVFDSQA